MKTRLIILLVLVTLGAAFAWRWTPWWQAYRQRQHEAQQIAAFEEALDARVTLGSQTDGECSLEEMLAQLRPQVAVPLVLDQVAVAREYGNEPIQLKIGPDSGQLSSILEEVLEPANLSFCRRGTALVVTTHAIAAEANQQRTLRQYALPTAAGDGTPIDPAADHWWDLIQAVADDQDVGNEAHIEIAGGTVTTFVTEDAHRRIRNFLSQFEQIPDDSARSFGPWSPAEREIFAALQQTASVHWSDRPLAEIVPFLAQHGIRAVFNERALDDAAVNWQAPVTLKLEDVPLKTILSEALGQFRITWMVRHDRLLITTADEAESQMIRVTYDVRDLVTVPVGTDFDSLIDLILTTIEPDGWAEGNNSYSMALPIEPGWLVIEQTRDAHEQIANLLALFRRAKIVGSARSWEHPPAGRKIQQALATEVKLEYYGESLQEVCDDLAQKLGINVVLDVPSLEDTGLSAATPVECVLPPLPLGDALELLLEQIQPLRSERAAAIPFQNDLTFAIDDELLKTTTRLGADPLCPLAVFDSRLLSSGSSSGEEEPVVCRLLYKVFGNVDGSFDEFPQAGGHLLVARAPWLMLRDVERLLDSLKEHLHETPAAAGPQPRFLWSQWGARDEAVWRQLQARRQFSAGTVVLLDEVRRICREQHVPLAINMPALRQSNADFTQVLTLPAAEETLQERLWRLNDQQMLLLAVRHGALAVDTQSGPPQPPALRLYWLGDLAADAQKAQALVGQFGQWRREANLPEPLWMGEFDARHRPWVAVLHPRDADQVVREQLQVLVKVKPNSGKSETDEK